MVLFVTLVLFLMISTVIGSLIFSNIVVKTFAANAQRTYLGNDIEIQSRTNESEMWIIDSTIYLYGSFWIRNSTIYDEMVIDNVVYPFDGSWVILDISSLNTGSYSISLRLNGQTIKQIDIWASDTNLLLSRVLWLGMMLFFISLISFSSFIPAYFLLMRPLRIALRQFAVGKSKKADLSDPEDHKVNLLIKRTDLVRRHLSDQIEHYQKAKNTLLTAIGILFAAYGLVLTDVIPNIGDISTQYTLVAAFVSGIVYLLKPANELLSDYRFEERLVTSWYHQGRISGDGQHGFGYESDLESNYEFICTWDKNKILKDNIREIVSLYYESESIESQYNQALSDVRGSVVLLASIILVRIVFFLTFIDEIMVFFLLGYSIFLIYLVISAFRDWFSEKLVVTIRAMYYCRSKIDSELEQNKGFQNIENAALELGVIVESTCDYSEKDYENIQKTVEEAVKRRGPWPKKKIHLYGETKSDFSLVGAKVPILIERDIGETSSTSVYPVCNKDGEITTIEKHLVACKEQELLGDNE